MMQFGKLFLRILIVPSATQLSSGITLLRTHPQNFKLFQVSQRYCSLISDPVIVFVKNCLTDPEIFDIGEGRQGCDSVAPNLVVADTQIFQLLEGRKGDSTKLAHLVVVYPKGKLLQRIKDFNLLRDVMAMAALSSILLSAAL